MTTTPKLEDIIAQRNEVIKIFGNKVAPFGSPLAIFQVGSHAYGLSLPSSDQDYRAVFIPNIDYLIGLKKVEQIRINEDDWVATELRRFIEIILKQNPTMLELLFIDNPIFANDLWFTIRKELRYMITRQAFKPYNAYVQSQLKKFLNRQFVGKRQRIVEEIGYDPKYISHCARLALQCIYLMKTGEIPVMIPEPYRSEILEIKKGNVAKQDALDYCNELNEKMHTAYTISSLPDSRNERIFELAFYIPLMKKIINGEIK